MKYQLHIDGRPLSVELFRPVENSSQLIATIDGRELAADVVEIAPGTYSILIGGRSFEVRLEKAGNGLRASAGDREFHIEINDPRSWRRGRAEGIEREGHQQILAPMPGKVVRVLVALGEQVKAGQGLLVVEAMKMQNEVRSPKTGTVEQLSAKEGQAVNAGEILAVVA
jgi:biotin carboxyl carrier protein